MYNGKVDVSRRSSVYVLMYCGAYFGKIWTDGGIGLVGEASVYITIVPCSISLTANPLINDKQNGFTREIINIYT
jgi:hypothetical protein